MVDSLIRFEILFHDDEEDDDCSETLNISDGVFNQSKNIVFSKELIF